MGYGVGGIRRDEDNVVVEDYVALFGLWSERRVYVSLTLIAAQITSTFLRLMPASTGQTSGVKKESSRVCHGDEAAASDVFLKQETQETC